MSAAVRAVADMLAADAGHTNGGFHAPLAEALVAGAFAHVAATVLHAAERGFTDQAAPAWGPDAAALLTDWARAYTATVPGADTD